MTAIGRSLVFAHRGANREAAENTQSAFERALAYPIDGIETDIQLSRDGVAVLWHDHYLGKLGLPNKRIADYDLCELQSMNFAAHFSAEANPEGIMGLDEFIAAYRQRCRLLLEIKNSDGEKTGRQESKVRQTLELAGKTQDSAIVASSFHLPSLIYAHRCEPDFPLIYNCESGLKVADAGHILNAYPFLLGLCLHKTSLKPDMVDMLRDHNKRIAVYTCNSDTEIQRALELGIDIIISDLPQKALAMRDAYCGSSHLAG